MRGRVVLATSREPLGVPGEYLYRVPSLGLPPVLDDEPEEGSAEIVANLDSVSLFIERAAAEQRNFELSDEDVATVASICRRLDGIPLAIELAAARLRSLSVAELEQRLDDRFRILTLGARTSLPRQRTLRATVDWSYQLLNDAERAVLWRGSVFAGGFGLDAAEAVCASDEADRFDVADRLASLVDTGSEEFAVGFNQGRGMSTHETAKFAMRASPSSQAAV